MILLQKYTPYKKGSHSQYLKLHGNENNFAYWLLRSGRLENNCSATKGNNFCPVPNICNWSFRLYF